MKAADIRTKTDDQLKDELVSLRKEALTCVFSRRVVN